MESRVVSGIVLTLLLIGMLTLAINIQTVKASPTVHNINTGLDYAMIQEAIDAPETLDGHTILVDAGTYYENVAVNKAVSLVGGNPSTTVINGGGIGDVVYVTADNVTIRSFTIRNSGSYYAPPDSGIRVEAGYCNITDNIIIDNSVGIYLYESSHNTLYSNNVTNKYDGIILHDSSNNVISGNNVTAHEYIGVTLSWLSSNNIISGNNIKNNGRGISCASSMNNIVSGNNVSLNNDMGIYLESGSFNNLTGNIASSNVQNGIYFRYSSNNILTGNIASSNGYNGIALFESSDNVLTGNIASNNGGISTDHPSGIALFSWSQQSNNNVVFHNNLINNTLQAWVATGCVNTWDDDYPSGGNYWSDYTTKYPDAQELDDSGIWDTPYVIDLDNIDHYPLVYPWSPLPVLNINTGLGYATIQGAINAPETLDGHTIFVEAGTYYENVVVNKTVSLIGENRSTAIIDGSGTGSVVTVTTNNTMISEFTIRESGKPALEYTPSTDTGILVFAGYGQVVENSTIINNDIRDNYAGVFIWYSLGNTVANNKIENNFIGIGIDESISNNIFCNTVSNNDGGIWLGSGGNNVSSNILSSNLAYGVEIDGSSFNTVDGNVIEYNEYGIYLDDSDSNTISGNILTNNDGGLILKFSGNNTLRNNNMTNNRWNFAVSGDSISDFDNDIDTSNLVDGKSVHYLVNQSNLTIDTSTFPDVGYLGIVNSKNVTVKDLSLTKNAQGVLFAFTDYSTIENVNVSKNWVGIQFWESDVNTVSSNIISNNSIGIILDFCDGNTIYHNNFINNELQAGTYESYSNMWDNGYPSGGNYWSDYTTRYPDAQELDDSGIWDTPYIIDDNNQDNYPLMEPWTIPTTIDDLRTEIEQLGAEGEIDNRGIVKSLIGKLNVAQKLVDKGKIDEAKSILEDDFIPQVQNLSGIHITPEAADILIQSAEYILSNL